MVYMMLTFTIVALMPLFILSIRAAKNTERVVIGTQLSTQLLEEIRLRKWDNGTPLPPQYISSPSAILGPDSGKNPADKRTFTDIDDFNGWNEPAALDPLMNPLPAPFSGYSRNATVSYVDGTLSASASPTDFKQVAVCTSYPKMKPICLSTLLTNR